MDYRLFPAVPPTSMGHSHSEGFLPSFPNCFLFHVTFANLLKYPAAHLRYRPNNDRKRRSRYGTRVMSASNGRVSGQDDLASRHQDEHSEQIDNFCESRIYSHKHAHVVEAKTPSVIIDSSFMLAFLGLGIVLFIVLGWAWGMDGVAFDAAKWDLWRESVKMVCVPC
jgi:hypothetical protein